MTTAPAPGRAFPWASVAVLCLVYVAANLLTRATFLGDTIDYAIEVGQFDGRAWDFGHLLWVPLGWLVSRVTGLQERGGVLLIFFAINRVAGLACVLLTWAAARRLTGREVPAVAAGVALIFTHGFLNSAETGSAYVPGLALMSLAVFLLLRPADASRTPWWVSVTAGAALAGSVCVWFPFVLAVPAVLLLPLVLFGRGSGRPWLSLQTAGVCAVVGGLCYGAAAVAMNVTSLQGLREWMARSSHGISVGGLPRMVFGLPRSFIHMGQDGLLFKRYLLGDPYNPVSLTELFGLSLWKLGLFYVAVLCLVACLLGIPQGRRVLLLILIGAVPVVGFGVFWQGGDAERYLPLYPFLFLGLSVALAGNGPAWARWLRWVPAGFFMVCAVVNTTALSVFEAAALEQRLEGRVAELQPLLKSGSRVIVERDELVRLPRDFPFDAETRALPIIEAATPGFADTAHWRQTFAETALKAWADGGDVWLSRRLLEPAPRPDSTWAEGDDPRLRWADVVAFFRGLEVGDPVGGADGFVRLVPSEANRERLRVAESSEGGH